MKTVFDEIKKLEAVPSFSKHDRLVNGIINAIDEKLLMTDDLLPSLNEMIRTLRFSRDTVVKGYQELINRGLIGSTRGRGYYVTNGNTDQTLQVALLMYNMDTFEEQFYRNFRAELGPNVHLNVFFHHGNIEVFETILTQVKGKYGMYVIAPIPHPRTKALLETIPRHRFLMVDRYEPVDGEFNHITQEFALSSYMIFMELAPVIRKFDEIIFYHSADSLDPKEIVGAFKKFLKDAGIKGRVLPEFKPGTLEKGKVYFTLDNYAVFAMLKECKARKLKPGRDLGILSHNDEPAKELIGITTYSADFSLMGKKAGEFVMRREAVMETMPMVLWRRATL
ncbi:GntR family transcriptional regulator [Dinghuibacter silviterrae]|uniref:Regulatory GntR family protein n=1 Tax=Dinghuibacter silviterrae TaxID=1539049 RepID=A0A4R8DGB6_9BACT|nr:GntR family transcriptional regulator [Dinghuibacter silviterrae]TDW96673.1 regulatory GntR family protein [Dinghuibacter silviterrae]